MENQQNNFKYCEICKSQAKYLCLECLNNYYCESCYKFIHDKGDNNSHKKETIDYFVPIDIKCLTHLKNNLDLFCCEQKGNIYFEHKY